MSDTYQSTNKLSQDPYPQTARLLQEGIITIPTSDYSSVTGGYGAISTIEITQFNRLGNRIKGSDPQTLKIEVQRTEKISGGGQIDDFFYPLPYTTFNNYNTGQVSSHHYFLTHNVYVIADDAYASYLTIFSFFDGLPGTQSFSYKIWSNIFMFADT